MDNIKVGDRVVYVGSDRLLHNKIGVVVDIHTRSWCSYVRYGTETTAVWGDVLKKVVSDRLIDAAKGRKSHEPV